jgi:hypothetical protein
VIYDTSAQRFVKRHLQGTSVLVLLAQIHHDHERYNPNQETHVQGNGNMIRRFSPDPESSKIQQAELPGPIPGMCPTNFSMVSEHAS